MFNFANLEGLKKMKEMKPGVVAFSFCILLGALSFSCQNSEDYNSFADCRYSAPEAVFSSQLPQVDDHRFSLEQGGASKEVVQFSDGITLTLHQRGCEYIEQEFAFRLSKAADQPDSAYWVGLGAALLRRLANLGPEYLSFSSWAKAIDQRAPQMQLGKRQVLQPGYVASVDRMHTGQYTIVVVTLAQEP